MCALIDVMETAIEMTALTKKHIDRNMQSSGQMHGGTAIALY